MNFTVIDAEQRSEAWHRARLGKLSGSNAKHILATIKSGEAAARRDYRMQLVLERITGVSQDDAIFVNLDMQRGIDKEPAAFAAYEALTGSVAVRTGFLSHHTHAAGCSLDGHVDDFAGLIEIKCPRSANHLRYWRGKSEAPAEHLAQIRHNLWITGSEWLDFLSYDDRFPVELQTFLVRVWAKDVDIPGYEAEALKFLAEVDTEVAALKTCSKGVAA